MLPYTRTEQGSHPEAMENRSPIDEQMAAVLDKVARMNKALFQGNNIAGHSPAIKPAIRVFIGAPGVGKSTCLAKWLVRDVLAHGADASVCRLDCEAADSTDALAVLCESLAISISRSWEVTAGRLHANQTRFVDLPGIDYHDNARIHALGARLKAFEQVEVYLVLNAAYRIEVLANQARAFATLPISGIILSHCDEMEGTPHLKDVSALVHGMDCPVRFLSSGRELPGIFEPPTSQFQTQSNHGESEEPHLSHALEGQFAGVHGSSFADVRRYL